MPKENFTLTCPRCAGLGESHDWLDDPDATREYRCWRCGNHRYPATEGHINDPLPAGFAFTMTDNPPNFRYVYDADWQGGSLDADFVRLDLYLGFGFQHTELFRLMFVTEPMGYAPVFIKHWLHAAYRHGHTSGRPALLAYVARERRWDAETGHMALTGPYACILWRRSDNHCLNDDLVLAGCALHKTSEGDIPPDWPLW